MWDGTGGKIQQNSHVLRKYKPFFIILIKSEIKKILQTILSEQLNFLCLLCLTMLDITGESWKNGHVFIINFIDKFFNLFTTMFNVFDWQVILETHAKILIKFINSEMFIKEVGRLYKKIHPFEIVKIFLGWFL